MSSNFALEHESYISLAAALQMSSASGGRWCVCVWSKSIVSSGVVQTYTVYTIHTDTHKHTHTQIQMQILEVTQRTDRVGRDLIKNGEVRVIKHHLNPPTSCDPAISQTPTTATHTINNAVWCQAGAALPPLRFRFIVWLNVRLKVENFAFGKTNTKQTYST